MIKVPKGFYLSTASVGFKYQHRDDLLFIRSEDYAITKGVFTQNVVKAAPVKISKERLSQKERFKGILVNVGQANACTGKKGYEIALRSIELVASKFHISSEDILLASTGVIGVLPKIELFDKGADELYKNKDQKDPVRAAKAIMTTDTFPKIYFKEFKGTKFLGLAKGAGMICPNMATMLCFILTDAKIRGDLLEKVLKRCVDQTFNRISVDGDTSTNDCVIVMANGKSEVELSEEEVEKVVFDCCKKLSYYIVLDGEGATKVIRIKVKNARSVKEAENIARSVGSSPLVKTAFFGEDPNWGRIIAAMGKAEVDFKEEDISLYIGDVPIWIKGNKVEGIEDVAKAIMKKSEIDVLIDMGIGDKSYEFLTCDLSYEYVKINAEYTT